MSSSPPPSAQGTIGGILRATRDGAWKIVRLRLERSRPSRQAQSAPPGIPTLAEVIPGMRYRVSESGRAADGGPPIREALETNLAFAALHRSQRGRGVG